MRSRRRSKRVHERRTEGGGERLTGGAADAMKRRLPFSARVDGDHGSRWERAKKGVRIERRTEILQLLFSQMEQMPNSLNRNVSEKKFRLFSEFGFHTKNAKVAPNSALLSLRASCFSFVISFDIPAPKCSSCKQGVPSARTNGWLLVSLLIVIVFGS